MMQFLKVRRGKKWRGEGWLRLAVLGFLHLFPASGRSETLRLEPLTLRIAQVDLGGALQQGPLYPRIDWDQLDLATPRVVTNSHPAYRLLNDAVELQILPSLGRVYALIHRHTGHNQLWTNPVARPIRAHNDTGWWMVWGGMEFVVPRGEHGTTWAQPWSYVISRNSADRKAVRMQVTEPGTGLQQTLEVSLRRKSPLVETRIRIRNPTPTNVWFAHWVNPMLAPGGRNELTAETRLVVPCRTMKIPERDFTRWMLGERSQPFVHNPLVRIGNWKAPGDLLAETLTADFFGAYCPEADEGWVRLFDRRITPGMDIWSWGFPPPPERQREYSLAPNRGYVEMWGGTSIDFTDENRRCLKPGESMEWTEYYAVFHGTGGLSWAGRQAVIFSQWLSSEGQVEVGIIPLAVGVKRVTVRQEGRLCPALGQTRDGRAIRYRFKTLSPQAPSLRVGFADKSSWEGTVDPPSALAWGKPYIDAPSP